ncbi:site-2 protease family protein [Pseudonocardia oroxyli]|uniref:Zn-dependent protease (Includes SpoIVFB) n=1 Tax=Pseudonocardia oroxyli TaxID=366584 RepID=A0A1G7VG72_PSEOR|nr:Zn-dependent protease (includes SpoIVFB) [Pseudonocardia oroxyli]
MGQVRAAPTRISPWFLLLVAVTAVGAVLCVLGTAQAREGSLALLTAGVVLLVLGGWCVSLCLHEWGHAYTAHRGGDDGIENRGYLTLDIRRYANVGLSFVLPVVFLLLGGIPLPGGAVWINQWALRSKRIRSLVSLAGPAMNLVIGVLLSLAVIFVPMSLGLAVGLSCLALIQILAFVLNILPVPGLDGYGVVEPWLSPSAQRLGAKVRPWAPLVLFVLVIGVPGVAQALFGVGQVLFSAIGGDADYAATGYSLLLFWR